jgi:DNA gyrase subunit A
MVMKEELKLCKADEIQIEDLIKNEEVIVTITHKGYLKRMPIDTYKAQKRGGKGVKGASSEDDFFTIFLQQKLMINYVLY